MCRPQSPCTNLSPTHHLHYRHKIDSLLLNETLVLLVRLVPIAVLLLRPELFRQLIEDDLQKLLTAVLVLCVPVPHGNLYSIPANTVRDPADVVVEGCRTVSIQDM